MIIYFPTKGLHKGWPASGQPPQTSPDLNNVRPLAGGRYQGGQRPGLERAYSDQIGGDTAPIVKILSITVVD